MTFLKSIRGRARQQLVSRPTVTMERRRSRVVAMVERWMPLS
jgi:hypothetical protein